MAYDVYCRVQRTSAIFMRMVRVPKMGHRVFFLFFRPTGLLQLSDMECDPIGLTLLPERPLKTVSTGGTS